MTLPPLPAFPPPSGSGKALLDDFADEVADIVGADGGAGGIDAIFQRHKASQKFGADLAAQVGAAHGAPQATPLS